MLRFKDEDFITSMAPHVDCVCKSQHDFHTIDWECSCVYCVFSPYNTYEETMRTFFEEWQKKGSVIHEGTGRIGISTTVLPIDVLVAAEYGLQWHKKTGEATQRCYDGYVTRFTKFNTTWLSKNSFKALESTTQQPLSPQTSPSK